MAKEKTAQAPTPAPPLARLFSDLPLDDGQELKFDFEGVARTLAELALNPTNRTPFAVAVRGGWGRGKTTLLKRTQWLLEHPVEVVPEAHHRRRVETLWFNAWKYPCEDTVLAGLLGTLLDRLHKGGKTEQLAALVDSYGGSLLKSVLYLAAPAALKSLISKDGLESRYSPVEAKRAFHDTFRDLFNQVSRLLFEKGLALRDTGGLPEGALWSPEKQERETLAIFLDDLDRCRQERVAEVLEAINLFVDLPGVCFYLGLDWERLVKALPEPLRGNEQGSQFLEKIFQVALDLPAVSPAGAEEFIGSLVGGTHLEEVLGRDRALVAAALESKHPRHIKRFLNDLTMTLAVLRNAGKLGTGGDQVPEQAALVWHLLPELLPGEDWRELRARTENVRGFLRRVEEAEVKGKAGEELPAEAQRWVSRGLGPRHFRAVATLSDDQLHVLVHLASPVAILRRQAPSSEMVELLDLGSSAWVSLPGGRFDMGSEDGEGHEWPVHRVTLSPFSISRYPVTNADYGAHVRESGKRAPEHWPGGAIPEGLANHPVVQVSWSDAEAFCAWLTRKLEAAGEKGVAQLPTEAQWELVARGTAGRDYPWGKEPSYAERANCGRVRESTTPVNAYPQGATPEGVHDLAGNVWEWCRDWYGPYPAEPETDPPGPPSGVARVLRGGSFADSPGSLRGACRNYRRRPEDRSVLIGFRVVWSRSSGLEGP